MILCYHARHMQEIHWSKLLSGMYGLMAKSSVATLNICQILMRLMDSLSLQLFGFYKIIEIIFIFMIIPSFLISCCFISRIRICLSSKEDITIFSPRTRSWRKFLDTEKIGCGRKYFTKHMELPTLETWTRCWNQIIFGDLFTKVYSDLTWLLFTGTVI